ncbi:hypothetical protein COT65_00985 [Candidatus Shapirobacteria bacterium CG09_land_8_20_14_0_10_47_13]|uniref:DUF3800 domain-containing protein n=1 Tax=Candidatus Shapirobacteria bacterium CG09_land_8_20_14_0_10_47_13 TaxID=1974481 RepID=A0A2H0WN12_9BACT|nr:MAG: hypothetical protein COT65_00985 [Candidatus Shapirobacteria bacterium CG09_land_8_20_14_0_10_47_13]
MRYALIDESGRLYDPKDRILVFTVLATESLVGLDKIIVKAREKISPKGKHKKEKLAEIKFSLTGDKTRQFVLKEIVKRRIKIYALVVDKEGRKIKDDPVNYAVLIFESLKKALSENPKLEHILIDRHFTFITQREKFNNSLRKNLKRQIFIEHLDSQQNPVISLADFIAGAIRYSHVNGDNRFKDIINKAIKKENLASWRKLKQKAASL